MKDSSILPSKGKKFVRIDHKTFIEVNENIPDEIAIIKFKERTSQTYSVRYGWGRPKDAKKKAKDEIDLEDSPDPDNYSLP